MAEFPYLPLWTDAYVADTQHLTTLEHGAYLLLLMAAWRSPRCDLPNNPKRLAAIARMTPDEWSEVGPTVLEFFDIEDGRLTQKRLLKERQYSEAKKRAGSKGGKATQAKRQAGSEAKRQAGSEAKRQAGSEANGKPPSPSPSPSSEPPPEPGKEGRAPNGAVAPSQPDHCQRALDLWNETAVAASLPTAQRLTDRRRIALRKRLAECGGIEGWQTACLKVRDSPFLCGDNDRGWQADIDFVLQPKSFTKLMEGSYDRTERRHDKKSAADARREKGFASFREVLGE